jgi:hypothetical protein
LLSSPLRCVQTHAVAKHEHEHFCLSLLDGAHPLNPLPRAVAAIAIAATPMLCRAATSTAVGKQ